MAPAVATYAPRDPSRTVLYHVIAEHLETFLASLADDPEATGLPAYVEREFYDYLRCGILAHGFLRLGCDTCPKELLLPFSCKRRGFCPSCAGRRMAQTAAHLVECVIPWVPTRQWVVSVPIPLRYWTASSPDLTAKVHTIIRTTIAQYYVNQAAAGQQVSPRVQQGFALCHAGHHGHQSGGGPRGEKPAGSHLYARRTVYAGAELRGGRARCVSGDPDRSPGHGLAPANHGGLPGGDHERPHASPALGEPHKPGEPAALSWA